MYDKANNYSVNIKQNAEQLLKSMKKNYRVVEQEQPFLSEGEAPSLVIIATPSLGKVKELDRVNSYATNGGTVFIATVPDPDEGLQRVYRKLGILELGTFMEASGVKFHTNVLIKQQGKAFTEDTLHNSFLRVKLDSRVKVHMTVDGTLPLMWEHKLGQGKYAIYNGTMLQEKVSRGVFAGAISMLLPDFMYPIMNAKIMYIDDFPAPFYGSAPIIQKEYGLDNDRFFKRVWWPDMIRIAEQYDMKYTGALIVTYHDQVKQPFDWAADGNQELLGMYGGDLLRMGGEIGLHGYNHQSLTLSAKTSQAFGYKVWTDPYDMVASIVAARDYVHSVFPGYELRSYVPPSNVLGREGRIALSEALPELSNVAALFNEDATHMSYVQEFKVTKDGEVELPRITSGYVMREYDNYLAVNVLTLKGYFSHFVHPDDVLSEERGQGMTWKQLYEGFEDLLEGLKQDFGWIRKMTSSEAAVEVKRHLVSEPIIERTDNGLNGYINGFTGEIHFILRTEHQSMHTEGCEISRIDSGVYLVKAQRERFSIEWKDTP